MSKKSFKNTLIALTLSISLLFTSCGSGSDNKIVENTAPVEIGFSWWGNDTRHAYTLSGIELFQNINPDINVTCHYGEWNGYEKRNQVYMKSNTAADVMQINYAWITTYSPDGNGYYDINELSEYIDLSSYTEEDLSFGMVDGKLNALPIAFNTPTIYYNKTIYDKYNLPLPETWDDLFEAAKVMSKDNVYPIGMLKKQSFLFLIAYYEQTTGKAFFDSNGKLNVNAEDMKYLLLFYKRLLDEKVMMPVDKFSRTELTNGTTAGALFWVSDSNNYCGSIEKGNGEPVLGEYPGVKDHLNDKTGWYMKPATMYAISKNSENPKQAAILLNYLVNSSEMAMLQKTEKGIPASRKAYDTLNNNDLINGYNADANNKMLAERGSMSIMLPVMENENVIDAFKNGADTFIYDKTDIDTAARNIVHDMNLVISEAYN